MAMQRTGEGRNPYGVMDVPDPNDSEVEDFAAHARLDGSDGDDNASRWNDPGVDGAPGALPEDWSSRWNGGADPTIPGDVPETWKHGRGEVRFVADRVYLLFDWADGSRRGLIDAKVEAGGKLVGKYINLTAPEVTRPWCGLIVGDDRIDGRWTNGRLDFRRS